MQEVICPYCGNNAELTNSAIVYHGRDYGPIYLCKCVEGWAFVGCHKGTTTPLGRLADRELREWKKRAHSAFDHLWKHGHKTRNDAYQWLARELNIEANDCHIGMFDVQTCRRVVEISRKYLKTHRVV